MNQPTGAPASTPALRTDDPSAYAAEMHAEWNRVTGQKLPYIFHYDAIWLQWKQCGLTKENIGDIVRIHRARQRRGEPARWILFRSLIGEPLKTLDDIHHEAALHRACKTPAETARESVQRAAGIVQDDTTNTSRTAAQVMGPKPDWNKLRAAVDQAGNSRRGAESAEH